MGSHRWNSRLKCIQISLSNRSRLVDSSWWTVYHRPLWSSCLWGLNIFRHFAMPAELNPFPYGGSAVKKCFQCLSMAQIYTINNKWNLQFLLKWDGKWLIKHRNWYNDICYAYTGSIDYATCWMTISAFGGDLWNFKSTCAKCKTFFLSLGVEQWTCVHVHCPTNYRRSNQICKAFREELTEGLKNFANEEMAN